VTAASDWAGSSVRELHRGLHVIESHVDEFDVRCAVVSGSDGALVWDTLAHPEQMRPIPALVVTRVVTVAYSHADWDHVWGVAALPAGGEIVAHEHCAARFRHEVPEELARRRAVEPGRWKEVQVRPPTQTFTTTLEVDLGGVAVQLSHLPGHTPDCCVAWIPAWGVLLAGDAVETPLPLLNDGTAIPAWLRGLRAWEEQEALELVVPAHGRIGGPELLAETRTYLEALQQGATPPRLGDLPAFYRRAHAENVRLLRGDGHTESSG
jgi:glyoxylase-like metal-dependent hydrolase (beta-lactamase superfamily II)